MYKFGFLDELGIKYNTDKASLYNTGQTIIKAHDYLKRYELFLCNLVDEEFALVELGCFKGSSLKMWKEYFKNARIIGVDLNEELKSIEDERIKFICADATSGDLVNILKNESLEIKCIIDDCSHAWADQRISFEQLFPLISSGGYYIIEDLECGSEGAYANFPPKVYDAQSFWDYSMDRLKILRVSENCNQINFRPFFYQLPKHIQEIEKSIDMSIILPGAIIFRKK